MPNPINEVIFTLDAQGEPGRFTILKQVREALGIGKDESPPLCLEITDAETGEILVPRGQYYMTSGPEIVDARTRAAIRSYQRIQVRASRADQSQCRD